MIVVTIQFYKLKIPEERSIFENICNIYFQNIYLFIVLK